jgi:hypothetical protein
VSDITREGAMKARDVVLAFAVTLAASGLFPACDDDGGGGSVTFEEFPAEVADVLCGIYDECYSGAVFGNPIVDCVNQQTLEFRDRTMPLWQGSIDAGNMTYHADLAGSCLASIRNSGCQMMSSGFPAVCEQAFEGNVEAGGPCSSWVDCAGDMYCSIDVECPGVCTERILEGQPCDWEDYCENGLYCQGGLCAPPAGEGDVCGGEDDIFCAPPLYCFAGEDGNGTCREFGAMMSLAEGEPCMSMEEGPYCQEGLSCVLVSLEPVTATCMGPYPSGGACQPGFPDPCPDGEYCNGNFDTGEGGSCVPLPGEGEPCAPNQTDIGPSCAGSLECNDSETCVALRRLGESCEYDSECYSYRCEGGHCTAMDCEK